MTGLNLAVLPKALRVLLGIGLAIAIVFVTYAYAAMQENAAFKPDRDVCIPAQIQTPTCFSTAEILSEREVTTIAVSSDGQMMASSWQNGMTLWDLPTGKQLRSLPGHENWVTAIAFSPDGKTLASGSLDATIKLWDTATGDLLGTLASGRITCLAFSPRSSLLASGSRIPQWPDGATSATGVQVWDLETQQPLFSIGDQPVRALTFNATGSLLAAGSTKTQAWKLPSKARLRTFDSGELTSLAFSRDGQTLITASSKIKLWQVYTGDLLDTLPSRSSYLSLSPDGQTLATVNGGTVNLWRMKTGRVLGTLRGSWFGRVTAAFGLNGQAIVTGSSDGVRIWRNTGNPSQPQAEPEASNDPRND